MRKVLKDPRFPPQNRRRRRGLDHSMPLHGGDRGKAKGEAGTVPDTSARKVAYSRPLPAKQRTVQRRAAVRQDTKSRYLAIIASMFGFGGGR